MEFDEYEYLEKTVENENNTSEKETVSNGIRSDEAGSGKRSKPSDAEHDSDHPRGTESRSEDDLRPDKSSSRKRSSDDRRSRRDEENGGERRRREDKERDRGRSRDREREIEKERQRSRRSRSRSERSRRSRSPTKRHRDEPERSTRSRSRSERRRDEDSKRSRRSRSRSERRRDEEDRSRRSGSRSERHHVDDRDSRREKSGERELRERESRRHKDKKEEAAEPEADPERDQRTVFAYQINLKADERDVYEFFSRAGKVRDVRLIMDRNSRRSKGVGYIEFYDVLSVPMAIALSGQPLLGQPVMVKPSEAEKNLVQSTTSAGTGPASGVARRLYAGNLPMNITEEQLRLVFEPFGIVELVQLPLDLETRQCKGYGFIQFARLEDAKAAQSLNGQLEIAGRTIKVSSVSEHVGMQETGTNAADLDDDEGGLALNAQSRAMLMQKLDRTGIVSSVANSLVPTVASTIPAVPIIPAAPADPIGPPSECLLLKNMFDPSIETEPDFDLDIKEDVQEECSKFGTIKHIFVDKHSSGFVYLRFDKVAAALNAQRALHGRWFAGKMISATFMLPQAYGAKFPGTG